MQEHTKTELQENTSYASDLKRVSVERDMPDIIHIYLLYKNGKTYED